MNWTDERPTIGGFYYWQDKSLRSISPLAVRLVQVSKYKNRDGFNCHTLHRGGDHHELQFDCDLGSEPRGRWAGPLSQPGEHFSPMPMALLWSREQAAFHIETLIEVCANGLHALRNPEANADFILLYVGPHQSCRDIADEMDHYRLKQPAADANQIG